MSKTNPRKAMAALLPPGQAVIRPMTLGVYAALERIGSPLVTGVHAKDTLELIPSLYLLTHDPREVFRGNIVDLAMQWADSVPVSTLAEIKDAADSQIRALSDVLPEIDDAPKKKTTAGSQSTPTGRRGPTTGPSRKSSGKSRPPRSSSSDARRSSARSRAASSRSRQ